LYNPADGHVNHWVWTRQIQPIRIARRTHILQKFDAADAATALASRDARIAELAAELAALKGQLAEASRA